MQKNRLTGSTSFLNASITTTVSISLVLFLLGLIILIGFMGKGISSYIKESLVITIDLPSNASPNDITKIQKQLDESSFVKSSTFENKDDILKKLSEELGENPKDLLDYNPLSNRFEITLKSAYANADSMKLVEKALKGKAIIKKFSYNKENLEAMNTNLSKIGTGMLIVAILLTFISFTLIRNTIRLNIYSKRFLINTMQLVGATNNFIRKPFVIRTVICGILAAVLANIAITALVYSLTKNFPDLVRYYTVSDLIVSYLAVFVLGILLTAWATLSAVNRYLKMQTNTLYHI